MRYPGSNNPARNLARSELRRRVGKFVVGLIALTPLCAAGQTVSPALQAQQLYNEGMVLVQQQRFDEAIEKFERGLRPDANNLVLLNALGGAWMLKGDTSKARHYFHQVLKLDPEFAPARKNLALGYFDCGEYDLAAAEFERLARTPESRSVAYLFLGMIAERRKQYEKAIPLLEKSGDLLHQQPQALLSLARSLHGIGRSNEALDDLRELADREPEGESLSFLAEVAEKTGKTELAVQALRKAIELEPDREDHYFDLGTLCINHHNDAVALQIVEAGLGRAPRSYLLTVQKGAALEKLDRREEAKATFREAMKLQSDDSLALLGLAITESRSDEWEDAIKTLAAGTEKFPRDFYLHYYYGLVLRKSAPEGANTDTRARARRALKRAVQLNPNYADTYYQLAKLESAEDPKSAAKNLEEALRLDPKHVAAKYLLGRLYLSLGRQKDGRTLLQEVRQEKSQNLTEDRALESPGFAPEATLTTSRAEELP